MSIPSENFQQSALGIYSSRLPIFLEYKEGEIENYALVTTNPFLIPEYAAKPPTPSGYELVFWDFLMDEWLIVNERSIVEFLLAGLNYLADENGVLPLPGDLANISLDSNDIMELAFYVKKDYQECVQELRNLLDYSFTEDGNLSSSPTACSKREFKSIVNALFSLVLKSGEIRAYSNDQILKFINIVREKNLDLEECVKKLHFELKNNHVKIDYLLDFYNDFDMVVSMKEIFHRQCDLNFIKDQWKAVIGKHKDMALKVLDEELVVAREESDEEAVDEIMYVKKLLEESVDSINFDDIDHPRDVLRFWPPLLLPGPLYRNIFLDASMFYRLQ